MNSILREQNGTISDSSEQESAVDAEGWEGIAEEAPVDHKDEYVDDDRFTTITIEAVNVTKDGLHKAHQGEDDEEEVDAAEVDAPRRKRHETLTRPGTAPGSIKRSSDVEPSKGVKKKKQKFRYESKAERKVTRFKERSGNKMKAKARKTL